MYQFPLLVIENLFLWKALTFEVKIMNIVPKIKLFSLWWQKSFSLYAARTRFSFFESSNCLSRGLEWIFLAEIFVGSGHHWEKSKPLMCFFVCWRYKQREWSLQFEYVWVPHCFHFFLPIIPRRNSYIYHSSRSYHGTHTMVPNIWY